MNEMLLWLQNNWYLIIGAIALILIIVTTTIGFVKTPKSKQIEQVKECLLNWVIEAEKQFGSKTGKLKLSYCWDKLIQRFPAVSVFISFETFSLMIDVALENMREMLSNNKNLQEYVYGTKEN